MAPFIPKLVRDKVPDRIRRDGIEPRTTRIRAQSIGRHLIMKMDEELRELHEAHVGEDRRGRLAEAADLAEAFAAYRREVGISLYSLWLVRLHKWRTHGRFRKRLMLLSDPYPGRKET